MTGSTGSGKSKFLEYLIRQDILNWRKNGECGLLLLDPHGAIYDGLMSWLARTSHIYTRPVIPIDLRRDDWVVAYNLLRRREQVATSVVTDNLVDTLAYVWGSGGTAPLPRSCSPISGLPPKSAAREPTPSLSTSTSTNSSASSRPRLR